MCHCYLDSGICLVIDFTQRQDADENNIKKTANYMKKFLSHHFAAELAATAQFRGIYVFTKVNEMDGSKVIRCAFSYKRLSSVGNLINSTKPRGCISAIHKLILLISILFNYRFTARTSSNQLCAF